MEWIWNYEYSKQNCCFTRLRVLREIKSTPLPESHSPCFSCISRIYSDVFKTVNICAPWNESWLYIAELCHCFANPISSSRSSNRGSRNEPNIRQDATLLGITVIFLKSSWNYQGIPEKMFLTLSALWGSSAIQHWGSQEKSKRLRAGETSPKVWLESWPWFR